MQKNESSTPRKTELVRFAFPEDGELALYALATLQSFAELYHKSAERIRLFSLFPQTKHDCNIVLHCSRNFYMMFRHAIPKNVVHESLTLEPKPDEMFIDLREHRLSDAPDVPGYSMQWWMGQMSGVKPKMLPDLNFSGMVINEGPPILGHQMFRREQHYLDSAQLCRISAYVFARVLNAPYVIAEQSFVSVLAAALGKPVIEITRTPSRRSLQMYPNYVQVSGLNIDTYFVRTIERALQCLLNKPSPSDAPSAVDKSSPCLQAPVLLPQHANFVSGLMTADQSRH